MGEINDRYNALFRLHSLSILKHPILGNIHLEFCSELGDPQGVYTSVIIGANGIGKSNLLKTIVEIFCCLESLHENKEFEVPRYYFDLVYSSHWERMEFANYRDINAIEQSPRRFTHFVFKKNDTEVSATHLTLPRRVIASATTIADKYIARSTEMYRYKGLRNENSPSSTGTRTLVRKTVDGLLGSLEQKYGFRRELKNLLAHLGLQPRLELSYNMRYKQMFVKKGMTPCELSRLFEEQDQEFGQRKTKLWGTSQYEKIKREEEWKLEYVAEFLSKLAIRGFDDGKTLLKYDLLAEDGRVSEDRIALKALSQMDLLTYPSLKVYKNEDSYHFDQSSSGESSLLCQMVSIMSDIEPNSLVLIDEPETSSHPNWQISYMGWLKKIFERYYNCHFVVSTHSHFLLTDLDPLTSDIIALEKNADGIIKDVSEGVNTFNWSVDDILYRVFHVRNTRNYVFEGKVIDLYKLVSERGDKKKVRNITEELSRYQLNEDDPIKKLLNTAMHYVESN